MNTKWQAWPRTAEIVPSSSSTSIRLLGGLHAPDHFCLHFLKSTTRRISLRSLLTGRRVKPNICRAPDIAPTSPAIFLAMDPLSALAIAAAVIQFADFGGRMLAKGWGKAKQLSAARDEDFASLTQQLSSLTVSLHNALEGLPSGGTVTPAQADLGRACATCDDICNELQRAGSGLGSADIALMQGKLVDVKASVVETVLLCLWYD